MTTVIFPGQGSQYVGMAKDFHDNFKNAKFLFEEIENYTDIEVRKIIFENKKCQKMIIIVDLALCTGYNLCASRQRTLRGLFFTRKSVL